MKAFKGDPKLVYKTYSRFKPWGQDGWQGPKGSRKTIDNWLHPTVDSFAKILQDEVARQQQNPKALRGQASQEAQGLDEEDIWNNFKTKGQVGSPTKAKERQAAAAAAANGDTIITAADLSQPAKQGGGCCVM